MICKKCGNYTQGEPKFCPFCGTPNNSGAQNTGNPSNANGSFSDSGNGQQYHYETQANSGYNQSFSNGNEVWSAPIKRRSVALCIILSLVTCGIYTFYWLYCLVNDLKTASKSVSEPDGGTVLLLSLVTCGIYELIWFYKAGEQVGKIKYGATGRSSSDGWLYLLLAILTTGLVPLALIQNELNQVATC